MEQPWWQKAVLYQVYVRSFADSNGDGVGDLRGVIDKLEYLEWLGIDGIWLSPVTVSPDKDWGYDVADYRDVQPVFGSLDDLDELVSGARARELRVILDDYDKDVLVDIDETLAVLRRWRGLVDTYEEQRILLGETWVMDLERLARFYGTGDDQLHLAFNFPYTFAPLEASVLRDVVDRTLAHLPQQAWPVWMLSNHDIPRFATRLCDGDERKIRAALLALLTLRGTAVLYQGDEIGLEQVHVPPERARDVEPEGRDGCRTPMPWTQDGGWVDPWLPLGETSRNVGD